MAPEISLRMVEPDDLPVLFAHQCDAESARLAAFPPRDREAFMMTGEDAFVGPAGQSCAELIFKIGSPRSYASPACSMPEIED